MRKEKKDLRKEILPFLSLVFFFSVLIIVLAKSFEEQAAYITQIYMLTPALAAIITRLFFYPKKFADSYLRLGKPSDYGRFYLLSLGITLLSFGLFSILDAVHWDLSGEVFLHNLTGMMGAGGQDISDLPAGLSPKIMLFLFFAGGLTIFNILPGLITGLGEELGWRDFLFPRLFRFNPRTAFLSGGLIWFLWHLPLSLIIPQTQAFTPWEQLCNLLILAGGSVVSFVYLSYVYVRSQSVIVTAFAHIVMNNSASAFSYFVVVENQLLANLGLSLAMLIMVAAFYFSGKFEVLKNYQKEGDEHA